ncbi:hypothetical protein ASD16_14095 [Cellulomonas sp. Root485]|nr:hypothetical protein ASD16_14095 [Cellulomonas sp. Root485]
MRGRARRGRGLARVIRDSRSGADHAMSDAPACPDVTEGLVATSTVPDGGRAPVDGGRSGVGGET